MEDQIRTLVKVIDFSVYAQSWIATKYIQSIGYTFAALYLKLQLTLGSQTIEGEHPVHAQEQGS